MYAIVQLITEQHLVAFLEFLKNSLLLGENGVICLQLVLSQHLGLKVADDQELDGECDGELDEDDGDGDDVAVTVSSMTMMIFTVTVAEMSRRGFPMPRRTFEGRSSAMFGREVLEHGEFGRVQRKTASQGFTRCL